jgi:MinD-like ATPase involved in chromosome partitioning or flagellar assembly
MAQEMSVAFLGSIPIDPEVGVDSDKGTPFILAHKDSAATKAFMEIVRNVDEYVKNDQK